MSNTVGYSLGCVTPVRFHLTQGEDATGNAVAFHLPSCTPSPIGDEIVTLSTISHSSTPTLIGFSEFSSPSSPPRKYKRKSGWGEAGRCSRSGSCDGVLIQGSDRRLFSGYDYYDESGVLNLNSTVTAWGDLGVCPSTTVVFTGAGLPGVLEEPPPNGSIWTYTDGPTLRGMVAFQCGYTTTGGYSTPFGENWIELSNEDTEDDAIARAVASPGVGAVASRTVRTTGFNFSLTTVEATLHCTNLYSEFLYRVRYDIKETNLATSISTLIPYKVDIPENSTSYDLAPVSLIPDSGFSLELVNYGIFTR